MCIMVYYVYYAFLGIICSFFFYLLLFYIFLPSRGWLCRVGVFGLIECPHSLQALHSGLQNNNNNNNNNKYARRMGELLAALPTHPTVHNLPNVR